MVHCNTHHNDNNTYDGSDYSGDGGGVIICKMINKKRSTKYEFEWNTAPHSEV
jgi:hypothetical protein